MTAVALYWAVYHSFCFRSCSFFTAALVVTVIPAVGARAVTRRAVTFINLTAFVIDLCSRENVSAGSLKAVGAL